MPVEALPWGSRSTTRTRYPRSARAAPRLTAVVDFPTPPFWFAIAMMRATPGTSGTTGCSGRAEALREGVAEGPLEDVEREEAEREAAPEEAVVTAAP